MCELMAISDNMEISPRFSFKEIKKRGGGSNIHRHGWGVGFYSGHKAIIIKEAEQAHTSEKAMQIEDGTIALESKIFITHIRYASSGNVSLLNTHPFKKSLFGKDWIFAHNGTVGQKTNNTGVFSRSLKYFKPEGETDSEYAFCIILDALKKHCSLKSKIGEIVKVIEETANIIKKEGSGNFNFIMSNSEYVFAYGDNSLYFLKRTYNTGISTLIDSDYSINISDMKKNGEKAVLIATRPLTKNEPWKKFTGLMFFKDGDEVTIATQNITPTFYKKMKVRPGVSELDHYDEDKNCYGYVVLSDTFFKKYHNTGIILLAKVNKSIPPFIPLFSYLKDTHTKFFSIKDKLLGRYRTERPQYAEEVQNETSILVSEKLRKKLLVDKGDILELYIYEEDEDE